MKNRIFAFLLATVFIFSAFALSSCGKDDDIVTEVRFTCYDNGEGDMVSFYMTSDVNSFGKWEYSIENKEIFDIFMDSEQTDDYGLFGWGGTASYRTLILNPTDEGESTVSFNLTDGNMKYDFSVKVTKDSETEKYKIEVKKK